MDKECPRIALRIACYTCGYPLCEARYSLEPNSCDYFGEYVPCERELLRSRNYEQYSKLGKCEIMPELTDNVMGFNYLIETIALKLAERTKLKV